MSVVKMAPTYLQHHHVHKGSALRVQRFNDVQTCSTLSIIKHFLLQYGVKRLYPPLYRLAIVPTPYVVVGPTE